MTNWKGLTPLERLMRRVDKSQTDCWEWTGNRTPQGYGMISLNGRHIPAHRAAYILLMGEIDDHLDLHHTCENKGCVNPDHLVAISRKEHCILDGRAHKPFCKRGHAMTEDNTYQRPGCASRWCRQCLNIRSLKWRHAHLERSREYWRRSNEKRRKKSS